MNKMTKSEIGKLGYLKSLEKQKQLFSKRIEKYNLHPKKCKLCNKNLIYSKRKNIFCSHSCSAKKNNKNRIIFTNKEKKSCKFCLKVFKNQNRKFCSSICLKNFREEKIQLNINPSPQILRKFLLRKREYKCDICNVVNWLNKKITLQVDHIDGNYQNNNLINLRFLCPNCHSQTDTYGFKNKGKGRHMRRQRYKEGKSS